MILCDILRPTQEFSCNGNVQLPPTLVQPPHTSTPSFVSLPEDFPLELEKFAQISGTNYQKFDTLGQSCTKER